MREIIVCGEALVDVVEPAVAGDGRTGGPLPALQPALGGGPFNVAITLGRLGNAVSLLTAVSHDGYGDAIVSALQASGVGTGLLQRRSAPTSLALARVGADGAAEYTFYVEGTADRTVADPDDLPPTVAALSFGTLSLVLEPGASVYERLMRRSHDAGKLVILDPNIRADVIADADAYRQRFVSWLPFVDVVKVSDEDADWLAQGPHGSTPDRWLAAGVAAVLTTRGAEGIAITTETFSASVPAPSVRVADTIGAGDSTLGAVLHKLTALGALSPSAVRSLDRDAWCEVGKFAAQVAATTVSRPGADPPWARELDSD